MTASQEGLFLSQSEYVADILKRAGMADCKSVLTPVPVKQYINSTSNSFLSAHHYRQIVGALQYLTITKLDISYSINKLFQYMHDLQEHHALLLK